MYNKSIIKFENFNIYFQDETRLGLITKQKKILSIKGKCPIGKYKHSYKYFWLWGSFSPMTGDSHYVISQGVSKDMFIEYLKDFSKQNPKELKIIVIDNAGFHSTKDIKLPDNIVLLPIPPYSPELNPAERVWQEIKSKTAMKIYDTLDSLESKVIGIINSFTNNDIKSLTNYPFIQSACCGIFYE